MGWLRWALGASAGLLLLVTLGYGLVVHFRIRQAAHRRLVVAIHRVGGGAIVQLQPGQNVVLGGSGACAGSASVPCLLGSPAPGLLVARGSQMPLLAALRRLPVLAPLLPARATTRVTASTTTYRVQIEGCVRVPACPIVLTVWQVSGGRSP